MEPRKGGETNDKRGRAMVARPFRSLTFSALSFWGEFPVHFLVIYGVTKERLFSLSFHACLYLSHVPLLLF